MEKLEKTRAGVKPQQSSARRSRKSRRAAAVVAAVVAAVAVWLLIEVAIGVDLQAPAFEGSQQGFDVGSLEVVMTSALASLAAWVLLGLLERWSRRPGPVWTWIAIGAFVVSLSGPMSGTGIPTPHRWLLALLHVVVAAVLIPLLYRTTEA